VRWFAVAGVAGLWAYGAEAGPQSSVVELFTSLGCSSCPPADEVVGRLSTNPAVLVLSFHVNYWDDLGWRDPFSSVVSTERQYAYARSLGQRVVFTPQLIVNGTQSMVGSREGEVLRAIAAGHQTSFPVQADLHKQSDGSFNLELWGPPIPAEIWEVRYVRHAVTAVRGGENGGRKLETFNNVTHLQRVGEFKPGTFQLKPMKEPEDGLAVIVQTPHAGPILSVTTYQAPSGTQSGPIS
jgi:hypothetical protein